VKNKDQTTSMEGEWLKTTVRKLIYETVTARVEHLTLVEKASVKPNFKSDMVHTMLELQYIIPLLLNPKTYNLLHCFQVCFRIRIALLVWEVTLLKNSF
jgi:hypothetical protein